MTPETDVDRLMAVMERAFDPHWREAWTRRQVEDSLLTPNCYMLIANAVGAPCRENEPAAGFVLARHAPGEDELLLIGVIPQARGKGVGTALIDAFEREAASRGAVRIFLEMRAGNPAESVYERAGFTRIGLRKAYYRTITGETVDALTFGKSLI